MRTEHLSELPGSLFIPGGEREEIQEICRVYYDPVRAFIAGIDLAGSVLFINAEGLRILEAEEGKVLGEHFIHRFTTGSRQSKLSILFDDLLRNRDVQESNQEIELKTPDGQTRVLRAGIRNIHDEKGNPVGIILSGTDLTAEKEESQSLTNSRNEAEELNIAKSEFLARVAHEVRTPLNAIMGFTEQLLQTSLDERQSEYLNIIDKSSEHLLSLINDVLVLSKVEAGELNFDESPFKLDYTLKYLEETLGQRAADKNLILDFDMDERLNMVLIGDTLRLRQILINFLSNAIKFTNQGRISLKCSLQAETEKKVQVRFEVSDTGIGIDPENLDVIFEEFKQADSNIAKRYGGTGLGLTICKNLIEMQNGSLAVTSKEGSGTTFTFTLPFTRGAKSDIVPHDLGSIDSDRLKDRSVLLVDDDSVNRLLGKTILEKLECDYEIAGTGKEAIEKLDQDDFDVVLLDIHLPDINGVEIARYLRREKNNSISKIIAVTAAVVQKDIKSLYREGIDDVLLKPFKEVLLYNKICNVLGFKVEAETQQETKIILREYKEPKAFDLSELKKMAGGDIDFVNQMLLTFISNTENSIILMEKFMNEGEWEQLGETAHKILPSFRHLVVKSVVDKLVDLKAKTIIKPDPEAVPELVEKIISEMKDLIDELKKEIRNS
jgi:PAS domain S-box-containing protein